MPNERAILFCVICGIISGLFHYNGLAIFFGLLIVAEAIYPSEGRNP